MGLTFIKDVFPIITNKGGTHRFLGKEVLDEFIVTSSSAYQSRWLIFENIQFINQVLLSDQSVGIGIKFIGCTFENAVTFNNITAKDSDILFDPENRSMIFIDCKFSKRMEFTGNKTYFDKEIHFSKCGFLDNILIENVTIGQSGIKFDCCQIDGDVIIQKSRLNQRLQIIDCVMHGQLNISNIHCDFLEIISCTLDNFLKFADNYISSVFSYYEGVFNGEILMRNNESPGTLLITGSVFKKQIRLGYSDREKLGYKGFNKLYVLDASFLNGFFLSGNNNFFSLPTKSRMESITIKCSSILKGDIHFDELDVCEVSISGFNTNANLVFSQVLINKLMISNFYNNAELVFSDVEASLEDWYYSKSGGERKTNGLFITEANMGKTHLFQVGLDTYNTVEIKNVIFSEIVTSNVSWFKHDKIEIKDERIRLKDIKLKRKRNDISVIRNEMILKDEISTRREIYRQLKFAMEKNGDRPLALEFQSIEMDYYRKLIKLKGEKRLRDRFILWSSQSNDFGQNWYRPILLLLLVTFILYIPIAFCVSIDLRFRPAHSRAELLGTLKELFWNELRLIPQLLNPVHNISALSNHVDKLPGIIYFFDFLDRIFVAYFVFQIVTAFRKYVR